MKGLKSIGEKVWLSIGMTAFAVVGALWLVSCKAQNIPTAPPQPTNSPTFTKTSTITGTPTSTPTVTYTSTVSATPTATFPPGTHTPTPVPTDTPTGTATTTPTSTPSSTSTPGPTPLYGLAPGSIVFTGFITNGNAQQAFAPLVSLSSGTTIYITNMAWDPTGASGRSVTTNSGETGNFISTYSGAGGCTGCAAASFTSEGTLQYISGGSVPANTTLFAWFNRTQSIGTAQLYNVGDVFNGMGGDSGVTYLLDSGNSTGDKMLAFTAANVNPSTGIPTGQITFLAAMIYGTDSWYQTVSPGSTPANYWDTYLPQDLINGSVTYATDLSGLFNSNVALYGANTNQGAVLDPETPGVSINATWGLVGSVHNWVGFAASRKVVGLPSGNIAAGPSLGWNTSSTGVTVTTYTY